LGADPLEEFRSIRIAQHHQLLGSERIAFHDLQIAGNLLAAVALEALGLEDGFDLLTHRAFVRQTGSNQIAASRARSRCTTRTNGRCSGTRSRSSLHASRARTDGLTDSRRYWTNGVRGGNGRRTRRWVASGRIRIADDRTERFERGQVFREVFRHG